jgi:hypothetical protein
MTTNWRNRPRAKRSVVWTIPRAEFAELCRTSTSIGQILKKFGLVNKGGNKTTVERRAKEDGVSLSHIARGLASNFGRKFGPAYNRLPLSEVFCVGSRASRKAVKSRVLGLGLIPNRCVLCGCPPLWHDKLLILVLDHINGIPNDNRIENLRLVCPNCNSQTSTFTGRNNRKRV